MRGTSSEGGGLLLKRRATSLEAVCAAALRGKPLRGIYLKR